MTEIENALGKLTGSVLWELRRRGGIYQPPPSRSPRVLSLAEREEISRGLAAGESLRVIARRLKRAPSTVSRQVGRGGGRHAYRAGETDACAWRRARRPKRCKLARHAGLRRIVASKLECQPINGGSTINGVRLD